MRTTAAAMISILILALGAGSSLADNVVIYQEDFSSDPGWTVSWSPAGAEFCGWEAGAYRVRLADAHDVAKFGYADQLFPEVGNTNFRIEADYQYVIAGVGNGMGLHFHDSTGDWNDWEISIHWDDHYSFMGIGDGNDGSFSIPEPTRGTWYHLELVYDHALGVAHLEIHDRDAGVVVFREDNHFFNPAPFNGVGVGSHCWYGEGADSEMIVDNLEVTVDVNPAVESESISIGMVKSLFR